MPPRRATSSESEYVGKIWPALMRRPDANIPRNQLGTPVVVELGVEGFCRNHLPDPQCAGGPHIWNNLAKDWELGYTGSGDGGRNTFRTDKWHSNYDESVPAQEIEKVEAWMKVRGVRDQVGERYKIPNPQEWVKGFQGRMYRFAFLDENGQEVPDVDTSNPDITRMWHGAKWEST